MILKSVLHSDHISHTGIAAFLSDRLGRAGEFIDEVIFHGILDSLLILPILFLTYLLMEFIEHKASDKMRSVMSKSDRIGPLIGGVIGAVPQCGFSAAASNLYTGGVITLGTLIAVFLSTSDEMIPILISGNVKITTVLLIILYKCVIGTIIGFGIDVAVKIAKIPTREINIDEICDNDDCHCERGILHSALHHTVSVFLFILCATLVLNAAIFFIGEDALGTSVLSIPFVGHLISAIFGLIPNCMASVVLTKLALSGAISAGAMISGLLCGAGVGLLVLFRMNKRLKENLMVVLILVISGVIFGLLADIIGITLL